MIRSLFIFFAVSIACLAGPVAEVVRIDGVAWLEAGQKHENLVIGQAIHSQSVVKTDSNSRLLIQWENGDLVTLGPKTTLTLNTNQEVLHQEGEAFYKSAARAISRVAPSQLSIQTKTALIGVRGTEFIVNANQQEEVLLREGLLEIESRVDTFEHYKKVHEDPIAKEMAEFEKYRASLSREFEEYKEGLAYEFQAYVKAITLKPMQMISLDRNKAFEGPMDEQQIHRFESYINFVQRGFE